MAILAGVYATLPSGSLFNFPPSSSPAFLPPPPVGSTPSAPPFSIPNHIYQSLLDPKVPITIAALYAITVKGLNQYNVSTGKKPWAVSQTRLFFAFVVLHNMLLAAYSAWTWWGMLGALRRSVVSPVGPAGWSGTVDSFCRLSGPRGLGNAAFFSDEDQRWHTYDQGGPLAAGGGPSRTETGRIWNEGLAFYGWIFYLSKFYEVLDTFIILAKGKLSSTLQTYHHAGAMMCMWAGMRYMSAPIWMFVFVNSGIHAMMYTYYTITAFSIKVPIFIKRTLTSLQITQFLVGASYAMSHSFISYTVPVAVIVSKTITDAAAPATTAAASAGDATPAALLDNVKSWIFGAVSRVTSAAAVGATAGAGTPPPAARVVEEVTYAQKVVPCITTTGETFAIWLNVLYLAPLTYLFVKFFITSYIRRSTAESARVKKDVDHKVRRLSNVTLAEKAGWDAAKDLEKEVYGENGSAVVEAESRLSVNGRVTRANGKANGRAKR